MWFPTEKTKKKEVPTKRTFTDNFSATRKRVTRKGLVVTGLQAPLRTKPKAQSQVRWRGWRSAVGKPTWSAGKGVPHYRISSFRCVCHSLVSFWKPTNFPRGTTTVLFLQDKIHGKHEMNIDHYVTSVQASQEHWTMKTKNREHLRFPMKTKTLISGSNLQPVRDWNSHSYHVTDKRNQRAIKIDK